MSETRDMATPRNAGERDRSTRIDASEAFDALTETIWRLRQPDRKSVV